MKTRPSKTRDALEKLNDPSVFIAFKAIIGGRFASSGMLVDWDADFASIVNQCNKVVKYEGANVQVRKQEEYSTSSQRT